MEAVRYLSLISLTQRFACDVPIEPFLGIENDAYRVRLIDPSIVSDLLPDHTLPHWLYYEEYYRFDGEFVYILPEDRGNLPNSPPVDYQPNPLPMNTWDYIENEWLFSFECPAPWVFRDGRLDPEFTARMIRTILPFIRPARKLAIPTDPYKVCFEDDDVVPPLPPSTDEQRSQYQTVAKGLFPLLKQGDDPIFPFRRGNIPEIGQGQEPLALTSIDDIKGPRGQQLPPAHQQQDDKSCLPTRPSTADQQQSINSAEVPEYDPKRKSDQPKQLDPLLEHKDPPQVKHHKADPPVKLFKLSIWNATVSVVAIYGGATVWYRRSAIYKSMKQKAQVTYDRLMLKGSPDVDHIPRGISQRSDSGSRKFVLNQPPWSRCRPTTSGSTMSRAATAESLHSSGGSAASLLHTETAWYTAIAGFKPWLQYFVVLLRDSILGPMTKVKDRLESWRAAAQRQPAKLSDIVVASPSSSRPGTSDSESTTEHPYRQVSHSEGHHPEVVLTQSNDSTACESTPKDDQVQATGDGIESSCGVITSLSDTRQELPTERVTETPPPTVRVHYQQQTDEESWVSHPGRKLELVSTQSLHISDSCTHSLKTQSMVVNLSLKGLPWPMSKPSRSIQTIGVRHVCASVQTPTNMLLAGIQSANVAGLTSRNKQRPTGRWAGEFHTAGMVGSSPPPHLGVVSPPQQQAASCSYKQQKRRHSGTSSPKGTTMIATSGQVGQQQSTHQPAAALHSAVFPPPPPPGEVAQAVSSSTSSSTRIFSPAFYQDFWLPSYLSTSSEDMSECLSTHASPPPPDIDITPPPGFS